MLMHSEITASARSQRNEDRSFKRRAHHIINCCLKCNTSPTDNPPSPCSNVVASFKKLYNPMTSLEFFFDKNYYTLCFSPIRQWKFPWKIHYPHQQFVLLTNHATIIHLYFPKSDSTITTTVLWEFPWKTALNEWNSTLEKHFKCVMYLNFDALRSPFYSRKVEMRDAIPHHSNRRPISKHNHKRNIKIERKLHQQWRHSHRWYTSRGRKEGTQ